MIEKTSKIWLLLLLVVLGGIVFRTYNFTKGFSFAHDQDLYSWIAKDIVLNKHPRLAGQVTSVDGVFIGAMYYYLMAGIYAMFNMNPISAVLPLTLIGVFNIISFFWIVRRFYGNKAGIIAAVIEALSFGMAYFERWSVPTQPTITWGLWFLFIVLELARGRLKHLWLYAVLVGIVWQIHIALLPILPIPFLLYWLSPGKIGEKLKNIRLKQIALAVGIFFLVCSPFWIFEIKHNFSQIKSTIAAMQVENIGPSGWQKVDKVLNASGREFQQRLIFGWEITWVNWLWLGVAVMTAFLILSKTINLTEFTGMFLWIFLIMLAQFTSKRPVSEYYFTNLMPVLILIISLFLSKINNKVLGVIGLGYIYFNISWLINKSDNNNSYFYRKELVDRVKTDVVEKGYPCIAINYISDPGVGVGFRYLFWYEGIKLVKANDKVPIYNIAIPWQISGPEVESHYGRFGIIIPQDKGEIDPTVCQDTKYTLDPLLGYTE